MNMNRWYLVFVALLLLGGGWLWLSRVPATAQTHTDVLQSQPTEGFAAPSFALSTLDGGEFVLDESLETPVVINFWATWCGPCRSEMPALQTAADRFDGQVHIVAVNQAESAATVQEFVDEFGLTLTIPMDAEQTAADRYNVSGLPTTFFVDRNGVIQRVWLGEMNSVTLAEGIAEIWP
jgi:thiol-disulfide isomerase/thioredoxin